MSAECPNGHGRQFITQNINVEGKEIKSARDVHIQKLKCGCQVGGPEYEKFLLQVSEIRNAETRSILALREATRQNLASAYAKYGSTEAV